MRVYELTEFGIENLSLAEKEMPLPKPRQVVVRISAVSLNYRDLMVVEGTYNPRMKLPTIPFSDAAGEVVEVGPDVERWKVGDRVCTVVIPGWIDEGLTAEKAKTAIGAGSGEGVLREFGAFHEDALVKAPDHLSYVEASTLPCAAVTAWHALVVSGGLRSGDTVLTLGTGGVSVFAVQFAKLLGGVVIVTSSSDEKLERIKRIGADHVINYSSTEDWDRAAIQITGGVGVDHVIEVGGTGTLARSVKAVRVGGHIALIGALNMSGEFNPIPIFMRNIRVQGIFVGSREMFESMNKSISDNGLRPVIDEVFSFEKTQDAFRRMKSGSHFGKIVIEL